MKMPPDPRQNENRAASVMNQGPETFTMLVILTVFAGDWQIKP